MYNTKEINKWLKTHGYGWNYLKGAELQEFMNSHIKFEDEEYNGEVCNFTGEVHRLSGNSHSLVGYMAIYKNSSGVTLYKPYIKVEA